MEYQQIVAATERRFTDEERDIETRHEELDTAQALIDRRRPSPTLHVVTTPLDAVPRMTPFNVVREVPAERPQLVCMEVVWVEYQQIVAATGRQFTDEERDIESRQAEVDTAQALLDRRPPNFLV